MDEGKKEEWYMELKVEREQMSSVMPRMTEWEQLLTLVVEDGASIGFLPPLSTGEARAYWEGVEGPEIVLLAAYIEDRLVGSVQLHLCGKPNGSHRAEIAKLMTRPDYRRRGVARRLMQHAEAYAASQARSLLVLDTREGDPSNTLYLSLGYVRAGSIPDYARSADGALAATVFYYKRLDTAELAGA